MKTYEMNKIPLVKVAKINMGQSPLSESYNKVGEGLPFFQGKTDFGDVYPKIRVFCTSPNKIAEADDILLSVRAPVGSINICKTKSCIGRGLAAIRGKSEIDQKYLYFFLKFYEPELEKAGKGSTFEAVNREDVENIEIPLPPLLEQKRIAGILDKADSLRRQRRYAQTLSDSFLQSVFVKMFGDSPTKTTKFPLTKIRQIADIIVPTRDKPKSFSGNISWITLPDINELFIEKTRHYLSHEEAKVVGNRLMPKNTVLLSCAGSLGKIAIASKETYANQQFYGVVAKENLCNSIYMAIALKMLGEDFFFRIAGISTLAFFSKDKALDIEIPLPPLPLQEKFAKIVQKFERIRCQQREATRQAEHLFQTLLHRAFRGEL